MKLHIVVDVDDRIDPWCNDPEDIAESLLGIYEENRQMNPQYPAIELVTAEW